MLHINQTRAWQQHSNPHNLEMSETLTRKKRQTTLPQSSRFLHHKNVPIWWWPIRPKHVLMYNEEKKTSKYYSKLHIDSKKWKTKSNLHSATGCCIIIIYKYLTLPTGLIAHWGPWLPTPTASNPNKIGLGFTYKCDFLIHHLSVGSDWVLHKYVRINTDEEQNVTCEQHAQKGFQENRYMVTFLWRYTRTDSFPFPVP
jgi:hypothetical protein